MLFACAAFPQGGAGGGEGDDERGDCRCHRTGETESKGRNNHAHFAQTYNCCGCKQFSTTCVKIQLCYSFLASFYVLHFIRVYLLPLLPPFVLSTYLLYFSRSSLCYSLPLPFSLLPPLPPPSLPPLLPRSCYRRLCRRSDRGQKPQWREPLRTPGNRCKRRCRT